MTCDDVLAPMTEAAASEIARWRYGSEYAIYDFDDHDIPKLLDPDSQYFAIYRGGEVIGHVCIGAEARVPGLSECDDVDDIGLGLRPDLTGRHQARSLIPVVLNGLDERLHGSKQRAVVANWNIRAQKAARQAGFAAVGQHENSRGNYVILVREQGPAMA